MAFVGFIASCVAICVGFAAIVHLAKGPTGSDVAFLCGRLSLGLVVAHCILHLIVKPPKES